MTTVVGSWTLTQGCGGIAYHCSGPASLQVPNLVVFHSDGTMDQFRAGVKVASGTFSITPSATDSLRAGTAVLNPGLEGPNETLSLAFSIEGQLILSEPCCDPPDLFVREEHWARLGNRARGTRPPRIGAGGDFLSVDRDRGAVAFAQFAAHRDEADVVAKLAKALDHVR